MEVQEQIADQIAAQPEPKRQEMQELHSLVLNTLPGCKLWYFDGRDENGKIVSNPTIGYGSYTIKYANGKTREFFQIGMSANKTGISVNILGIEDKTFLTRTFGARIGKASVTGYCIRFKSLKDIDVATLEEAIRYGASVQNQVESS